MTPDKFKTLSRLTHSRDKLYDNVLCSISPQITSPILRTISNDRFNILHKIKNSIDTEIIHQIYKNTNR